MSDFDFAVAHVLKHEGGYVDNPRDHGGETNFGISKRAYPNVDVKNLTREKAAAIYRRDYWDACRCDDLSPALALCVFDCAVNSGPDMARRTLQRVLGVNADGVLGKITMGAAKLAGLDVVARYQATRIRFYCGLPTFPTFGKGWVLRAADTLDVAMGL